MNKTIQIEEELLKARANLVFRTDLPYRLPNGSVGYRKGWVLPEDAKKLDRHKQSGGKARDMADLKHEVDLFDDGPGESWGEDEAPVEPPKAAEPPRKEPALVVNTKEGQSPLYIESLTDKAIIVRGDTRTHKEEIKAAGGRWNGKHGGWIFPKSREGEVRKKLGNLVGGAQKPVQSGEEPAQDPKIAQIMGEWKKYPDLAVRTGDIAKDYGTSPAWLKKQFDSMVESGELVSHTNQATGVTKYAIPGSKGANELAQAGADIARKQGEVDRSVEKMRGVGLPDPDGHQVGETITKNGVQYVLNDNHRWEKVGEPAKDTDAATRKKAADKLRTVAESLEEKAEHEINRDRLANTARRARMADGAIADAQKAAAIARTMKNLANAIESGDAKKLSGVNSRAAVENLDWILRQAVSERDRKRYETYSEQQRHQGRAPEKEDLDFAKMPEPSWGPGSDRLRLLEELKGKRGAADLKKKIEYSRTPDAEMLAELKKYLNDDKIRYSLGWWNVEAIGQVSRLYRIGIKNQDDLREALREYMDYRDGPKKADPLKEAERALIGQKVGIDFFPTPKALAGRMADMAGIKPGMEVLEPSAGNGNLADAAREAGASVDVVEVSDALRNILELKGHNLAGRDFESHEPEKVYDAIIMNPPFGNRKDAEHIQRAYNMLKPGGKLVAIAGEGVFFGSDNKAASFRDWLDSKGADVEKLPENTFKDKDLMATTGVNARLIEITKPMSEGPHVGDTKTIDGVTYRLNANHRWERVDDDSVEAQVAKVNDEIAQEAAEVDGLAPEQKDDQGPVEAGAEPEAKTKPLHERPLSEVFDEYVKPYFEPGQYLAFADYDRGKAYAMRVIQSDGIGAIPKSSQDLPFRTWALSHYESAKANGVEWGIDGSSNTEQKKVSEPKPDPKPLDEVPTGSAGLKDMRDRLSVVEPQGGTYEKKYGTWYITKDGENVAKFAKWTEFSTGKEKWSITDLKERKSKNRYKDPGEIVPACYSKEEALEKYAMKLFAEEQEKKAQEAEKKERAKKIRDAKRAAAITNANPVNRQEASRAAFDDEAEPEPVKQEPYNFTPGSTRVNVGGEEVDAPDYTGVIPMRITLANKKTVMDQPRPSYIPMVTMDGFDRMEGRIEGVKIGEDRYLIVTDRSRGTLMGGYMGSAGATKYAVVNLATLVATQDYYSKLRKARHDHTVTKAKEIGDDVAFVMRKMSPENQVLAKDVIRSMDKYKGLSDEQIDRLADIVNSQYNVWVSNNTRANGNYPIERQIESYLKSVERQAAKSKPRMIGSNKMTFTHSNLITKVTGEKGSKAQWAHFHTYLNDMKQASLDMELQMEETANTYLKGQETSYGRKGAVNDLMGSHGVAVKRQNGDEITPMEVDEIKKALDDVYSVFGDRSELAKRSKLLISHSGDVMMHARKAVGIYIPGRNAIGVSWNRGQQGAGFTLAHEFAHFMDNQLGLKGGRHHYISDDRSSLGYKIADTFRENMAQSQDSDYYNRTCECFARAFDYYFAVVQGDHDAHQATRNGEGTYPKHETYIDKVKPLIDQFFKENDHLLKSLFGKKGFSFVIPLPWKK